MLLIWGFRARSTTVAEGVFFCPTCGGDRHYAHKRARRWFTLFWIPLIPLKQLGEFVECKQCRSTFNVQVLQLPTTAGIQQLLLSATRESVVALLRAGGATTAAVEAAARTLSGALGRAVGAAEVRADVSSLDLSGLIGHLGGLTGSLSDPGRESFLAGCVEVAVADGPIDPAEQQALEQIGQALQLSSAHARGVILETVDRLHQG